MNSAERHERRYQRRRRARLLKKQEQISQLGRYDDLFTYDKLYNSFFMCREGVRWKKSIQSYEATLLLMTFDVYRTLHNRWFKPYGFLEFDLIERGKTRHIRAVTIKERCIQRILCDEYLIPLIRPKLIYDNGASIKGKGTTFSVNRLKAQLHHHYRKYGTEGYIFQYDFSSYFDNIDHDILLSMLYEIIPDKEIFNVVSQMITCFGEKGLGLGSQVSQICAVWYPTIIDRYFQEVLGIHGYGRYNDDGYAICKDLNQANACKEALIMLCDKLHIKINQKKLRISRINDTIIFLKKRFQLTDTGKVIVKIDKSSVTRARRRLKKLSFRINDGTFTLLDFNQSYRSWIGMAKHYDNYKIIKSFEKLYRRLLYIHQRDHYKKHRKRRSFGRYDKSRRVWTSKLSVQVKTRPQWKTSIPKFSPCLS